MKRLILVISIVIGLAACQSKTAYNYSEGIIKKEKEVSNYLLTAESKLKNYGATQKYDSISAIAGRVEKLIQEKISEINNEPAPDVKEGESFKAAAIKYFNYMKEIFTNYKDFANAKTDQERNNQTEKIRTTVNKRFTVLREMQNAQKKFADANGFKLEKR